MNIGPTISAIAPSFAPRPPVALGDAATEQTPANQENASGPKSFGSSTESSRQSVAGLTEPEKRQVRELAARDREVRAHEQAHASVGGRYASAPSYTYQKGPNGQQYAVAGEVSIDVSPVANDPQATIDKARIVRRAALAPAQPSPQDRAVAAEATALEQQARAELLAESVETSETEPNERPDDEDLAFFYTPIDLQA